MINVFSDARPVDRGAARSAHVLGSKPITALFYSVQDRGTGHRRVSA